MDNIFNFIFNYILCICSYGFVCVFMIYLYFVFTTEIKFKISLFLIFILCFINSLSLSYQFIYERKFVIATKKIYITIDKINNEVIEKEILKIEKEETTEGLSYD